MRHSNIISLESLAGAQSRCIYVPLYIPLNYKKLNRELPRWECVNEEMDERAMIHCEISKGNESIFQYSID